MTPDDLVHANLRENPFRITPGENVTIWAGQPDLRMTLEKAIVSVRNDKVGLTECIALYGELGTGKSHALRFFQTYIETNRADFQSPCVYLETLRVANRVSFVDIYKAILKRVGRQELVSFSKVLVTRIETEIANCRAKASALDHKAAHDRGEKIDDTWFRESLELVLKKYSPMYGVFEQLSRDVDSAWFYISANNAGVGDGDLARMHIANQISSDFEAVEHLGMLVNLMCGVKLSGNATYWKAFYLFLDEVEILADLDTKHMVLINQSLRDLLNACPENFCMILGLTGDAALVEGLFSQYLLSRLTREPIPIPSLDQQTATEFLKEVLQQYRREPAANNWYPFTNEAVVYIVSNTTDKTPRRLFMNCRRVLEMASGEGILSENREITREDAERFLS